MLEQYLHSHIRLYAVVLNYAHEQIYLYLSHVTIKKRFLKFCNNQNLLMALRSYEFP
jgi:hypothetical protein